MSVSLAWLQLKSKVLYGFVERPARTSHNRLKCRGIVLILIPLLGIGGAQECSVGAYCDDYRV